MLETLRTRVQKSRRYSAHVRMGFKIESTFNSTTPTKFLVPHNFMIIMRNNPRHFTIPFQLILFMKFIKNIPLKIRGVKQEYTLIKDIY